MKKYSFILCIILLFSFTLCIGCNKSNEMEDITNKSTVNYIYDESYASISEHKRVAFSEKGYYFLTDDLLCFYDIYNDVTIPLCSKVSCSHKDENCGAYARDTSKYTIGNSYYSDGDTKCLDSSVWYYNGKIYMIRKDKTGIYFIQYDSDYTNETTLCTLGDDTVYFDTAKLYDGYLYYTSYNKFKIEEIAQNDYKVSVQCKRVKIGKNMQPELLGVFDYPIDVGGNIAIKPNADSIYFMGGYSLRTISVNTHEASLQIYKYDIADNKFVTILEKKSNEKESVSVDFLGENTGDFNVNLSQNCVDDEGNIYISTLDPNILKIMPDGTIKKIYGYKNGDTYDTISLIWDGKYIYFVEAKEWQALIQQMDKEGNIIGSYPIKLTDEREKELISHGKEHVYLSSTVQILGIDKQNILLAPINSNTYIEGLEARALSEYNKNKEPYDKNYLFPSMGIIPKEALQDNSIQIKKIYECIP